MAQLLRRLDDEVHVEYNMFGLELRRGSVRGGSRIR